MTTPDDPSQQGATERVAAGTDEFSSLTFEELVDELEEVARKMDSGDLGIEAAAELYGRAAALHGAAVQRLSTVRSRLDALRVEHGSGR